MSPSKKTKKATRPAAKRAAPAPARRAASARPKAAPRRKAATRAAGTDHPHPLGMGVADGFAMRRLKAPAKLSRSPKRAVREIGWAAFGDISRTLSARIGERFLPDVVLGVAKGGVFVGGALAAALGADFHPLRIEKRRRDPGGHEASTGVPELRGKRVLVVDDVASSGGTLKRAGAAARAAGAREVKTAVLVVRHGGARPDWFAVETDELVLFGWDYHLHEPGGGGAVDPGEVGV